MIGFHLVPIVAMVHHRIRPFLKELNKDSSPFWELSVDQVRAVLTGLQNKTPVDLSAVTTEQKDIVSEGKNIKLYIMRPGGVREKLPVLVFIHGGVWIAVNFENHRRLLCDLVVGAQVAGIFVEYTPIPDAVYPTQLNEIYAAMKWVAAHGDEINVDASRMAVAGNSVGGNMAAAITLMAKARLGLLSASRYYCTRLWTPISTRILTMPPVTDGFYQGHLCSRFRLLNAPIFTITYGAMPYIEQA
jgi:acetyl esterase